MALEEITAKYRYLCDRCTNKTPVQSGEQTYPNTWAKVELRYTKFENDNAVGLEEARKHLCHQCKAEIIQWFQNPPTRS